MIRVPYLDYELTEFLSSLPPLHRFQQRVYKKMLVDGYPNAAHVPWAYTQKEITSSWSQEFGREWLNYWTRRIDSLWNRKKEQLPVYAFRDNATLLREDRVHGLAVYEWLESDRFDHETFNQLGIRQFMDSFYAGDASGDDYLLFGYLCGIARADHYLLSGEYSSIPDVCNPAKYGVLGPSST